MLRGEGFAQRIDELRIAQGGVDFVGRDHSHGHGEMAHRFLGNNGTQCHGRSLTKRGPGSWRALHTPLRPQAAHQCEFKTRVEKKFTTGAWVEYLVFNPDGTKLLASSTRKSLDGDTKAISAFKKEIQEQKKALR